MATDFAATYDELIALAWVQRHIDPPAGDTGNLWFALADGALAADELTDLARFPIALNEVQTLTITGTPTGGTFTITFGANTTAAIAYNATAADVQDALMALQSIINPQGDWSEIGAVRCTGGPLPDTAVVIEFYRALGHTSLALATADGTNLTGGTTPDASIAETTDGKAEYGTFADDGSSNGRRLTNTSDLELGNATGPNTATHGHYYTAETGGTFIQSHALPSSVAYSTDQPVRIQAGALTLLGAGDPS